MKYNGTFDFDMLLEKSVETHGHICPGQVLGVRMSMLGLTKIGITDPRDTDRKSIMVFVEMDRCATDAVQSVTGCTLGHRTMKFLDYGKMAATYLNLKTDRAVRIIAREDARDKAKELFPQISDKYEGQTEAYKVMSDEELFDVAEVSVMLKPEDMPGRPLARVVCEECGEHVQDRREVLDDGKVLCKSCSAGSYYHTVSKQHDDNFLFSTVMQNGHNDLQIRSKIWVDVDGEPVFGKGRMLLLKAIGSTGSITQAAQAVNISYRRAWGYIKAMEERLGIQLVDCHAGGKNGGGASLTPDARSFLDKYEELDAGIRELVDKRFLEVFGNKRQEASNV